MSGEAALLNASWKGDVHQVAQILEEQERRHPGDNNNTAATGINVTFQDDLGWNALHWAAGDGHESVVRFLLNYSNLQQLLAGGSQTTTDTTRVLMQAKTTAFGSTPLHRATQNAHANVVRVLLEAAAAAATGQGKDDMVNAQRRDGFTALHQACRNRDVNVIRLLLQHGADSQIQEYQHGKTPYDFVMQDTDSSSNREQQQETETIRQLFRKRELELIEHEIQQQLDQQQDHLERGGPISFCISVKSSSKHSSSIASCASTLDTADWMPKRQQHHQQHQPEEKPSLGDGELFKNVAVPVPTLVVQPAAKPDLAASVTAAVQPTVAPESVAQGAGNNKNRTLVLRDFKENHRVVVPVPTLIIAQPAATPEAVVVAVRPAVAATESEAATAGVKNKNKSLLLGNLKDKDVVVPVPTLVVRQEGPWPTLDSRNTGKSSITSTWIQQFEQQENQIAILRDHIAKLQLALDDKVSREAVQELLIAANLENKKAADLRMMHQHQQQQNLLDSRAETIMLEAKVGRLNADMYDMRMQLETLFQEKLTHYVQYQDEMMQQNLAAIHAITVDESYYYDKAYQYNNHLMSAVILLLVLYTGLGSWMSHQRRFRQQQQHQQQQQQEKTKKRDIVMDQNQQHKQPKRQEMDALFHALLHCFAKLDAEQRAMELGLIHNALSLNRVDEDDDIDHADSSRDKVALDNSTTTRMAYIAALHKCAQEQQQQQTTSTTTTAATATADESSCLDVEDDDTMPSLLEPEIMDEGDDENNNNVSNNNDKCVVSWNTTLETIKSDDDSHDFELVTDIHSTTSSWSEQQEES